MNKSWTEEKTNKLEKLWNENKMSASEIAEELGGVTRNAVLGKVNRIRERNSLKNKPAKTRYDTIKKRSPKRVTTGNDRAKYKNILDVPRGKCLWPNDKGHYCGKNESKDTTMPYCEQHHARAVDKTKKKWLMK